MLHVLCSHLLYCGRLLETLTTGRWSKRSACVSIGMTILARKRILRGYRVTHPSHAVQQAQVTTLPTFDVRTRWDGWEDAAVVCTRGTSCAQVQPITAPSRERARISAATGLAGACSKSPAFKLSRLCPSTHHATAAIRPTRRAFLQMHSL